MRSTLPYTLAATIALSLVAPGPVQSQIEIPLRSENAWFIVEVDVNGTTLDFILDTGAGITAVSEGTKARLELPSRGRAQVTGASGGQTVGLTRIDELIFGGQTQRDMNVIVLEDQTITPYGGLRDGFEAYDGVLGVDVFARWDLLIDPDAGTLTLLEPGADVTPDTETRLGPSLVLRAVGGRLITIPVQVNGVETRAVLDTGSRRMILSSAGARAAEVETRPPAENATSQGVGDHSVSMEDADFEVATAGTDFGLLPGHVADLPVFEVLGLSGPVLLMGNPALRNCLLYISYRTNAVRLCAAPGA